jgi:hypothetical protein
MLKKLAFAAILIISIASCGSKKAAFNYSENFVKKENSLLPDITATEDKVERFVASEQYDSIAVAGEKMEQLVETKIQEIKKEAAPDVKEAENFKEACIKYFGFIKSMYTSYKEFGLAKDETEREKAKAKVIEIANSKQSAMTAMQTAQKKFADANGFRLEKK